MFQGWLCTVHRVHRVRRVEGGTQLTVKNCWKEERLVTLVPCSTVDASVKPTYTTAMNTKNSSKSLVVSSTCEGGGACVRFEAQTAAGAGRRWRRAKKGCNS